MSDSVGFGFWPLSPRASLSTVVAALLLYGLLFSPLFPLIGDSYFVLGLVPAVLAGLLLGFRPAIYTAIVVTAANLGILMGPLGTPPTQAVMESFPLVTLLIGGTTGYFRDVRVELTRQRDELRNKNERLDGFARLVSHDLRNPLNVAAGRLEMARGDCDSDHLDAVARSHARMESLIEDMLLLARGGEAVGETEAVDLASLTERCWSNVETADATLVTDVDSVVRADGSRLQQLLENLVRNAVEHGGGDVTVTIGDLDDGFYVQDDGHGLPEGAHDKLFEMGYSSRSTGTGFGLGIVFEIADAHGWSVHASEGPGGGARFEISGVDTV